MPDITGTTGADTITGTTSAEQIFALSGNDLVNAGDGNDTIYGSTGNDTLNGEDGDDTFVEDQFSGQTDTFNGGNGFDTIELRAVPTPLVSAFGSLSPHSLAGTVTMTSIERIVFASSAGQVVQATLGYSTWASSGITQIIGGAGRDFITVGAITTAGTYTMPNLPLSGWDGIPTNAWEFAGDFVALAASTPASASVTLNALSGASFFQIIAGGQGADVLNGSDNADILGTAGVGGDTVNAGGGNDAISLVNSWTPTGTGWNPPTTFTGAGGVWDGGSGTDVVSIGGYVQLLATLSNIEGVYLQAPVLPSTPNTPRQDAAYLVLDSTRIGMLPSNAFFSGQGTVEFNLDPGQSFNGAAYTITPGSNISFVINGGDGDGLSLSGNSGDDVIQFGFGIQTATGGAGADYFRPNLGRSTITDFTIGVDKLDFTGTGISNSGRLGDLNIQQVGADAVISATTGGEQFEVVFQNRNLADLSDSDVIYGLGGTVEFDLGTTFDDLLFGFELNDELHGDLGNDRIYGGGGVDKLYGDGGNDAIVLDGAIGAGGLYDGGTGFDTLVMRPYPGMPSGLFGPTATFNLTPNAVNTGLVGVERLQFESVATTAMTAIVLESAGVTQVAGGDGVDQFIEIVTTGGTHSLSSITLSSWSGGDFLTLFTASNVTASVTLNARSDVGNQSLVGAQGNDVLNGSGFADFLNGSTGVDTMTGGAGDDTYVVDNIADVIVENSGEGIDTVQVSAGTAVDVTTVYYLAANVENMVMTNSAGGQAVVGNALSNLITGTGANDVVVLGDTVSPYTSTNMGNDTVNAGGGNDFLFFNRTFDANDVVDGGAGYDTVGLLGPVYTNLVLGANSLTNVEQFSMYSSGDAANPNSYKLTMNDANVASGQQLLVTGMSLLANETLYFDGSAETNGRFLVFGGRGADTIIGGAGNDRIIAGDGADRLTGNGGNDVFQFNAASNSTPAARDTITDFTSGDKIDLWFLDANANVGGNQHFNWIGTNAFGSVAGQLRVVDQGGGSWLVEGDTNGDGVADFSLAVTVADSHALGIADFLL